MEDEGEVFLGHSVTQHKMVSDETAHIIDKEIRFIIDSNFQRAEHLLLENMEKLHLMAEALIKYETIDASQIDDIMSGRQPRPPEGWDDTPRGQTTPPVNVSTTDTDAGDRIDGGGRIGGPAQLH